MTCLLKTAVTTCSLRNQRFRRFQRLKNVTVAQRYVLRTGGVVCLLIAQSPTPSGTSIHVYVHHLAHILVYDGHSVAGGSVQPEPLQILFEFRSELYGTNGWTLPQSRQDALERVIWMRKPSSLVKISSVCFRPIECPEKLGDELYSMSGKNKVLFIFPMMKCNYITGWDTIYVNVAILNCIAKVYNGSDD